MEPHSEMRGILSSDSLFPLGFIDWPGEQYYTCKKSRVPRQAQVLTAMKWKRLWKVFVEGYFHSPCTLNPAQSYGAAHLFSFDKVTSALLTTASGRSPS